jgi:hypothetical protein
MVISFYPKMLAIACALALADGALAIGISVATRSFILGKRFRKSLAVDET